MTILHTADWHIGKRLQQYNRLDEQRAVLNEIISIAETEAVDVVLVAGDLFDVYNPTPEAEDLLYSTLKRMAAGGKRLVIAIAGNHDNPERIAAQDHFGRECGILFVGFPQTELSSAALSCDVRLLRSAPGFVELQLPQASAPVRIMCTPYANEYRMRTYLGGGQTDGTFRDLLQQHWQSLADKYLDEQGVNLLVAHLFMMKRGGDVPTETDDEKSIVQVGGATVVYSDMVPTAVQYAALGHLHRYQELGGGPCPVVYSSSPLAYSFAEEDQQKFVVVVELEAGQPALVRRIPLQVGKRLHRPRFTAVTEAVSWLEQNPDCYTEVTIQSDTYLSSTDLQQLREAHPALVSIVPDLRTKPSLPPEAADQQAVTDNSTAPPAVPTPSGIDLSKSMDDLFVDYFKSKHKGQEPNDRLKSLFREILATDEE